MSTHRTGNAAVQAEATEKTRRSYAHLGNRKRPKRNSIPLDYLTPTQRAVGDLVAQAYTDTEIAEKLGLSHPTVVVYVNRIKHVLQAKNRVDIAIKMLARPAEAKPKKPYRGPLLYRYLHRDRGLSPEEIADRCNARLKKVERALGIKKPRPKKEKPPKPPKVYKGQVYLRHVTEENLTVAQIATMYGISEKGVCEALTKFGFNAYKRRAKFGDLRKKPVPKRGPEHHNYGRKFSKNGVRLGRPRKTPEVPPPNAE